MKTLILFLAILIGISSHMGAQVTEGKDLPINPDMKELVLFSAMDQEFAIISSEAPNQVFIKQVGQQNFSDVNVKSEESSLNLNQNGSQNFVNLSLNVRKVYGNVIQSGDNNFYTERTYGPSQQVTLNLEQKGNNLYLERYGSNSIGNKLNLKMTGDNKTIIVRNFK
ncbi:MAG: hypothetical protein WCE57_12530 [Salegentibacter sp.]